MNTVKATLDGSKEMMARVKYDVTKHCAYIQDFPWPEDYYDCVLGFWCLCTRCEREMAALGG